MSTKGFDSGWIPASMAIGGAIGHLFHQYALPMIRKFGSNQNLVLPDNQGIIPEQPRSENQMDTQNSPGLADTMSAAMSGAGAVAPSTPQVIATAPVMSLPADPIAHPVVKTIVNQVYADPTVQPEDAAHVAAGILSGVAQYAPAILQVTRASPVSSMWTGIGIGVLSALIQAFYPHPALKQNS
jgi:hypothetical protein